MCFVFLLVVTYEYTFKIFLKWVLCFTFWCQPLRCFKKRGFFFLFWFSWTDFWYVSSHVLMNPSIYFELTTPTCSPCTHCMCSNLCRYLGQFDCVSFLHFTSFFKSTPCSIKGETNWYKVFLEQYDLDFF